MQSAEVTSAVRENSEEINTTLDNMRELEEMKHDVRFNQVQQRRDTAMLKKVKAMIKQSYWVKTEHMISANKQL